MAKSQRNKGVRGELLWRDFCNEHSSFHVQRGHQTGVRGSIVADVVGLPLLHQEVKNVERLNVRAAMEQSERDALEEGRGRIPILAHKTSRKPWLVTLLAGDFFRLYNTFIEHEPY